MTEITDQMVQAAMSAFQNALNDTEPCRRCTGTGYHHGFGEGGHDPDWCMTCGGSGFDAKHTEQSAMKMAITAALSPHSQAGTAE